MASLKPIDPMAGEGARPIGRACWLRGMLGVCMGGRSKRRGNRLIND
jgi:hypothetical protein